MQVFETKFVNKRSTSVDVFEYGKLLTRIEPGETRHVESRSPKTSWARWSVVKFSGDDKVSFDENKNWEWPYPGMLALEALNIDGKMTESFPVAGEYYHCYRGIPKLVPVDIHDTAWAFVARLEWRLVEHKVKDGDYIVKKNVLEMVKTMRSKKEVRDLQKQLLLEVSEKAKEEMKRHFPKAENGEETLEPAK